MQPETAHLPDIARLDLPGARIAHCRLPAWEHDAYASVSAPASVAVSFTAQSGSTVTAHGRYHDQRIVPGALGLTGEAPVSWVAVDAPSDLIEITADAILRRAAAEDAGPNARADLADVLSDTPDPVAWGLAARLRAAARGGRPLRPLEGETLVMRLYAHVQRTAFGASAARTTGLLDARRIRRVTELMDAAPAGSLSVERLADAAALSPFHFMRSFRRTTGLAPHQYLTARRLQAAADLIRHGLTPAQAVSRVGYASAGQGIAALRRWLGR